MIDINEIKKIIPHRYPFLLVDKIIECDMESRIVGVKNVTINEPFFQGHFPEFPVMPGVLIIEALAQVACILGMKIMNCLLMSAKLVLLINLATLMQIHLTSSYM